MFSTTTIASSTTKPVAIVSAINEMLSRLKFITYIIANDPSNDKTTTTPGIKVAQRLRRNKRTTSTTRPIVSTSVSSTSCTAARIVTVRSRMVSTVIVG